ncbi:unnamed protein product [Pleuronectes platessa]|uniref:Uncharacterized protein n=1 Tax=Pleuronectes platessa TaxID=8262 RepID=A0A9N7YNY4_PLEPL|nr:unnamed protein product [Pleuronectes platessa]
MENSPQEAGFSRNVNLWGGRVDPSSAQFHLSRETQEASQPEKGVAHPLQPIKKHMAFPLTNHTQHVVQMEQETSHLQIVSQARHRDEDAPLRTELELQNESKHE